jgi:hypothetical protein
MIKEAAYKGNLGMIEMLELYKKASKKEIEELEIAIKKEDWEAYKKIVKRVLNINLK